MKNKLLLLLFISTITFAQEKKDSSLVLSEIVVKGYETERLLSETAGGINVLKTKDLIRQNEATFLSALNRLPGVSMEERSPGSYRLNIRGSALRSPFGVRNVKVYWNDIQLTDANGSTYLNAIDPTNIGSIEVLKGPGSSVFGAGTGGVVLLQDKAETKLQAQFGSFNTSLISLQSAFKTAKVAQQFSFFSQKSDGFREHSNATKISSTAKTSIALSAKQSLNLMFLFAVLDYRTPGGLNQAQAEANPRASRPRAGAIAGALEQNAGINQKNGLVGLSYSNVFSRKLAFYASFNSGLAIVENPFITNFEQRREQTIAARSRLVFKDKKGDLNYKFTLGAEANQTFSKIDNFGNKKGIKDTVQFNDTVLANQHFAFAQAEFDFKNDYVLTIGGSFNKFAFDYNQSTPKSKGQLKGDLPINFSPRVSFLKKISSKISTYIVYSEGFTPPSVAEYATAARQTNQVLLLDAERAKNLEFGLRGNVFKNLFFDLNHYRFAMQNTIVRRVDAKGNQYFVNAGNTQQNGFETMVQYAVLVNKKVEIKPFLSTNFTNYQFQNYTQIKTDLSGKKLPGIPAYTIVSGLDLRLKKGLYTNLNTTWVDEVPLNDANTFFAKKYTLLAAKIGYDFELKKIKMGTYAGLENALNAVYSLGNDFNAVGNRFYNPAASRSFYGGVVVKF